MKVHPDRPRWVAVVGLALAAAFLMSLPAAAQEAWFAVRVVDDADDTPLSGVRLETTHRVVLVTDTNGVAAFYEPGLMGVPVWFTPTLQGFDHASDAFGFRGLALTTTPGGEGVLRLTRTDPAAVTTSNPSDRETRLLAGPVPNPAGGFAVHTRTVTHSQARRGVPLTQLFVGEALVGVTDNAGRALLFDPDLITDVPRDVVLEVVSDGYVLVDDSGAPQDSVGVTLVAGGEVELELVRTQAAERLYRITGAGSWRDTVLLGRPVPVAAPLLAGGVVGQDSALSVVYRGEGFVVWGDTNRISYPLGNFHAAGARFALPDILGVSEGAQRFEGLDLRYIEDENGFAAPLSQMPGPGPTWLDGLVVVDDQGVEALYATYGKYPELADPVAAGLVRFNDDTERFEQVLEYDLTSSIGRPEGQPLVHGGHLYFRDGVRVGASPAALEDPSGYEAFTPLFSDGSVERDDAGAAVYRHRVGGPPLRADNTLAPADRLRGHEHDVETGDPVVVHGNDSVVFHAGVGRYVKIVQQVGGSSSFLGELFLFAADTPHGPWAWGAKIVTHDGMTFYNPRIHSFLSDDDIYFEGTSTQLFSSRAALPRADYNQVMMRVPADLSALRVPAPLYPDDDGALRFARDVPSDVALGAPVAYAFEGSIDFPFRAVPVGQLQGPCRAVSSGFGSEGDAWFFALEEPRPGTVPLTIGPGGVGLAVGGTVVTRGGQFFDDRGDDEGEDPSGLVLGHVYPAFTAIDPETEVFRTGAAPPREPVSCGPRDEPGRPGRPDEPDDDVDEDVNLFDPEVIEEWVGDLNVGCGCTGGPSGAVWPVLSLLLLGALRRRRR